MTLVTITIKADMRLASRAPECFEQLAAAMERELRALDGSHPTLGRSEPAVVTAIYAKTEHGHGLGRFGRSDGWAPATTDKEPPR